jgi:hypothetical protein
MWEKRKEGTRGLLSKEGSGGLLRKEGTEGLLRKVLETKAEDMQCNQPLTSMVKCVDKGSQPCT